MNHSQRITENGLVLPAVAVPVGSYVPAIRTGNTILTSGQLPMKEGELITGKVPTDVDVDAAAKAAEIAVLNAVAAVAEAAGGIDNIKQIVRMCVYVNSAGGFVEQPKVANGASNLLVDIFGDAGKHVRSAVGAPELPLNACLEIELIAEV